jgi:hypothetical protein
MWRFLGVLLLFATPALAQENATAYEALRVVGTELGRGALNHVVSITGVKGDPQPKKWKIIWSRFCPTHFLRKYLILPLFY